MTEVGESVEALHARVDLEVERLSRRHAKRLRCRSGCSSCCIDGITVFAVEAERIRRNHAALLVLGVPHPVGACAFLDADGSCRIYADRPYVCRTQGLPLRWFVEDGEQRDICELNDGEPDIVRLPATDCFTLGPFEEELVSLQTKAAGRPPRRWDRVPLRDLFEKT
ncbi:MAG: YkgJ family cysteine cluster protein [Myxococcales bacterium]|nr:YkgJ family cysteine cluster protein [Myxococcales bacterium]